MARNGRAIKQSMNVFAKNILCFYLTIINYIMEDGTLRIIQCVTTMQRNGKVFQRNKFTESRRIKLNKLG